MIDDRNRKDLFLEMVRRMDMGYSYKPVLIRAILHHADEKGRVKLSDILDYFHTYYECRQHRFENGRRSLRRYLPSGEGRAVLVLLPDELCL